MAAAGSPRDAPRMFGRMSFVHGDPERIDELIEFVTWTVKPATDRLAGNLGLGMWVDRGSGGALVMSVWTDEASLIASETTVTQLRDDGAAVMRGIATVERYETTLIDAVAPHRVGNVMRMMRMSCEPRSLDEHTRWTRNNVLPVMRRVPGYLSHVVAVHRGSGRAVSMSTYRDGSAADIAYAATAPIRTAAVNRGITIDGVQQYEVALVGIRAGSVTGTAPVPTQRTIELPSETRV